MNAPAKRACMVCGRAEAPCFLGWPGFAAAHPKPIRDMRARHVAACRKAAEAGQPAPKGPADRLRICAFGAECEAQAIARIERAAGAPYPFTPQNKPLAPRVAEILGRPSAPERRPVPKGPQPAPRQGALL
ncbi:hypothetical protein [Tropicimonas sp. IMCC34043]|uniref:hypothetical protein n=1 Tax=Tropicimonas sp. IMCC34043 TaxID=2248760 RepID=UPI000E285647|nr:hypothetical protein [Tropicimonas sp. IMCC34043]